MFILCRPHKHNLTAFLLLSLANLYPVYEAMKTLSVSLVRFGMKKYAIDANLTVSLNLTNMFLDNAGSFSRWAFHFVREIRGRKLADRFIGANTPVNRLLKSQKEHEKVRLQSFD